MKKTVKSKSLYIFVCILFLVFLFFLNDIVLLSEPHKLRKSDLSTIHTGDQNVLENVEGVINYDNNKEMITIKGYAIVKTEKENIDRYVKLIFVSKDSDVYEVDTNLVDRSDVMRIATASMGRFLGYETFFSPIKMKEGMYELYIKVYENNEAFATKKTLHRYIKDSKGLHEYYTPEVDFSELGNVVFKTKNGLGGISNSVFTSPYSGHVLLVGNFNMDILTSPDDKLYMAVENQEGISKVYDTFFTTDTAFATNIPEEQVGNKAIFKLILKIKEDYYIISEFSYIKAEE